jgi:U3 small nucleolar RNA-associated protein 10
MWFAIIDFFDKLGSYILFASLSQKCRFSPAALQVVMGEIISASHSVRTDQFVAVCAPQDALEKLPSEVLKGILGVPYGFDFCTTLNSV